MPDPVSPDDPAPLADLLRRAGAGDAVALEELLRRYERRVRLAARSLLRPPLRHALDSLDLVQSVHRALLPGLRGGRYSFATEDQLVGLAVTVLRHKVRRTARKTQARPGVDHPRPEPAADSSPTAASDAKDLVERLLNTLDETDRRLVELRLMDLGTGEVAAELGCTPAVVRARLSRIRKRLRDAGYEDVI